MVSKDAQSLLFFMFKDRKENMLLAQRTFHMTNRDRKRYPHSYQQNVENYVDMMLLSEFSE